jgi:hypothetical protein
LSPTEILNRHRLKPAARASLEVGDPLKSFEEKLHFSSIEIRSG